MCDLINGFVRSSLILSFLSLSKKKTASVRVCYHITRRGRDNLLVSYETSFNGYHKVSHSNADGALLHPWNHKNHHLTGFLTVWWLSSASKGGTITWNSYVSRSKVSKEGSTPKDRQKPLSAWSSSLKQQIFKFMMVSSGPNHWICSGEYARLKS